MSPSEPTTPWYPPSALALYTVYASSTAAEAAGIASDPYDPTKPLKGWAAPNDGSLTPDAGGNVTFQVFDPNGPANQAASKQALATSGSAYGLLSSLVMPLAQALSLNLPGAFYPAYKAPAACMVDRFGPAGETPGDPINVQDSACLLSDAQAIAAKIWSDLALPGSAPQPVEAYAQGSATFWYQYPAGEQRRVWQVTIAGVIENCQELIEASTKPHGIGAPGKWVMTATGLVWNYMPPPSTAPAGEAMTPVPVRPLQQNEVLVFLSPAQTGNALFNQAGQWRVERADLQQPTVAPTVSQQIAALMQQVATLEQEIAALEASAGGAGA